MRGLEAELNIEDYQHAETDRPNYSCTDTHWPDHNEPEWNSADEWNCDWHWRQPHERDPATSTYPLLATLLTFCIDSPSALKCKVRGDPAQSNSFTTWNLLGNALQSVLAQQSAECLLASGRAVRSFASGSRRQAFVQRILNGDVRVIPYDLQRTKLIKFFSKQGDNPHELEVRLGDSKGGAAREEASEFDQVVVHAHFAAKWCNDCKKRKVWNPAKKDWEKQEWEPCKSNPQQLVDGKSPPYDVVSGVNVRHGTWEWMEQHWEGNRSIHHLTHWDNGDGPDWRNLDSHWNWRDDSQQDRYPLLRDLLGFCLEQAASAGQEHVNALRSEVATPWQVSDRARTLLTNPVVKLVANLQAVLTTPRAQLPQTMEATRCFSSGEERNSFLELIRNNAFRVATQHHGHGVGFFSMAAKAWKPNDTPHQLEVVLLETWLDDAFECLYDREGGAAQHRYSVTVHIHFKSPRCQDCSRRQCTSGCDPVCKFPLTECKATCAAVLPPWEPCNVLALGGSGQIYIVISSVDMRDKNMDTDKQFGQEPLEKHKGRRADTHWEGGAEGEGPEWDSADPLESEWQWQLPDERDPAKSKYPLLCELLNFCLRGPEAQALRSSDGANVDHEALVEKWASIIHDMITDL